MSKVLGKYRGRLLGVVAALLVALAMLQGAAPTWWSGRGLLVSGAAASDRSPATQGQLKNMARAAMEEMGAQPGSPTYDLVAAWRANKTQAQDQAIATIGQLKAVAKPFYVQLGLTYPWTTTTSDDVDQAPATIGQLKAVFSFAIPTPTPTPTATPTPTPTPSPTPSPTPTPTPTPGGDSDGDGIPDEWEIIHGLDPGDPDDGDLDPDGDGFSNFEEYEADTDPQYADSKPGESEALSLRFGYWQFPTGTSDYGSDGQQPLTQVSREIEASPWGSSLKVPLSGDSLLTYRDVEPNGSQNIDVQRGSVRLWFKPSWSSVSVGGTGPTSYARLIEIGSYSENSSLGHWVINFDPNGSSVSLFFQNAGASNAISTSSFAWTAGQWHQIVVTYSATSTKLYLDGTLSGSGAGVTAWPDAAVRATGFSIGTNISSGERSGGSIAELETFNYELPATEVLTNYQITVPDPNAGGLSSFVDTDGDGLPDSYQASLGGQGAADDNDADGLSNLTEYLAGSDPLESDGVGAAFTATRLKVFTPLKN